MLYGGRLRDGGVSRGGGSCGMPTLFRCRPCGVLRVVPEPKPPLPDRNAPVPSGSREPERRPKYGRSSSSVPDARRSTYRSPAGSMGAYAALPFRLVVMPRV